MSAIAAFVEVHPRREINIPQESILLVQLLLLRLAQCRVLINTV